MVSTKPKSKTLMMTAIAVAGILVVISGLYFLLSGGGAAPPSNKPTQPSNSQSASGTRPTAAPAEETFTVDATEGRAEVFRNGERVGTTPYKFQSKAGEHIDLVLKREGYEDKAVRLSTSDKKTYTFMLEKKD
jgi:hypothetical protein